jgi:hypothetical protein
VIDRSGIWPTIAGGCHPARVTIMQAGFDIKESNASASPLSASNP